jgi:polyisoprenoid-binding protein YceI
MSTTLEAKPASATTWQLDTSHTNVEFAVKHLMISTVKGRFGQVSGTIAGTIDDPENVSADISIGVESIDTRQGQRDAHLRSPDFFDALKWPTIRFVGKRAEGDLNADFLLHGELTIRDVTREIALNVTNEGAIKDPWGNERIGFSASAKIDRRDFGLTWNQALEAGGFAVGNDIRISIDAEFTAATAGVSAAA